MSTRSLIAGAVVLGLAVIAPAYAADEFVMVRKKGSFDDVRFELGNAVTTRGLAIHSEGNLDAMLKRTGADVGSTKEVFKSAQFIQFCSAVLTRKLVEIDPGAMGFCPFGVFVYESIASPGEVVVGYRRVGSSTPGTSALDKAKAEVDALLAGIARDALK